MCARIYGLFDCANKLYVNVQSYSDFNSINTSSPIVDNKFDSTTMGYTPGGPGSIVVVTLYYEWPINVSLLDSQLVQPGRSKASAGRDFGLPQRALPMKPLAMTVMASSNAASIATLAA